MTQFQAFEDGIEVNGQTISAVVAGLGAYKSIAIGYLEKTGLGDVIPDDKHWYPQQAWLNVFRVIWNHLGDGPLFHIGLKIPESAVFPTDIDTIEKALSSIDVAYHMNHRNRYGEVLFDPTRPPMQEMLEGIGHYGFEKTTEKGVVMVCDNPYPCAFDRGIIQAMATRFEKKADVRHEDLAPCRKRQEQSCTFRVTW